MISANGLASKNVEIGRTPFGKVVADHLGFRRTKARQGRGRGETLPVVQAAVVGHDAWAACL